MPSSPTTTAGDHASGLIRSQQRRLRALHDEVLSDRDPEDLHQLRVSLRRLRTLLHQFAPALHLPQRLSERRLARITRSTGLCRDLDVLRERLHQDLLPLLGSSQELPLRQLDQGLQKRRRKAFGQLAGALEAGRLRELLDPLEQWLEQPAYTALGEEPIGPWLADWQGAVLAGIFLEEGWRTQDPQAECLHELRKRLKGVRYGHENLAAFLPEAGERWIHDLKASQDVLGELHDLQVLGTVIAQQAGRRDRSALLPLRQALDTCLERCWRRWCSLAPVLLQEERRRELQGLFLLPQPALSTVEATAP
ncbi:MAG: CHAD domain-containing protein [Prochlorococcaceae cyanobacterium]